MQDELEPGSEVQHFAFGGIANPGQSAFLRGSDRSFLEARQAELDAFEKQRLAYNDALTKYQTEVYNPYKTQVDAYNTAASKYNTDVYNPYKSQVDAYNAAMQKYNEEVYNPYASQYAEYEKAVNAYNEGGRESDYAGPAAPTLARNFDMTLPTQPEAFGMTAPTAPADFSMKAPELPFKEEDVIKYQQEAAARAREDAGNRATAIEVVSNPDQFNFGSMSVSNRFMAEGGPVEKEPMGQARKMMDDLSAPDDDAALVRMLGEITNKGKLSKDQVLEAVDRVAAAGRGGDELLAYLSPESMAVLKKMGGAGTINPATGLPEFKGGVLGRVGRGVRRLFGREPGPKMSDLPVDVMQRDKIVSEANAAEVARQRAELAERPTIAPAQVQQPSAADMLKQQETAAAKAQQDAVAAALKADADNRAKTVAQPVMGTTSTPKTPELSDAITMLKAGNKDEATNILRQIVGLPPASQVGPPVPANLPRTSGPSTPSVAPIPFPSTPGGALPGFEPRPQPGTARGLFEQYNQAGRMMDPMSPDFVGPRSPDQEKAFQAAQRSPIRPISLSTPGQVIARPMAGAAPSEVSRMPSVPSHLAPSPTVRPMDPEFLRNISRYDPNTQRQMLEERQRDMGLAPRPAPPPGLRDVSDTFVDLPRVYAPGQQAPVGIGPVDSIGSIPIGGISTPAMPTFGGSRPTGQQQQATSPNNYFAQSQPAFQGGMPGTIAAPYNPMSQYQGPSPVEAIAQNPNLSPTMLGGAQNAGMMTDRLGNRIYAPATPPFGFAKGGQVDIDAMRALVDASNVAEEEEGPTVDDYAGEAKRMLASIQPTRQTAKMSRTRLPATGGGAETPKEMGMASESLTERQEFKPKKAKSAQAELRALAKQYSLKQRAAENQARGLMQNTLGAPTLEQPTLTQEGLQAKRFQKGGEAKKADAGEVKEPSLFGVSDYATKASARMFPDQLGQDDQRDAARHMLAAATVARKYGPKAAELLGKAHEYTSNPHTFFSALGIGKARDDLPYDLHNNQVGVELAARTKSQAELEKLVETMARQAQFKQTAGKPWIMSREQMQERERRFQDQQKRLNEPPEYKHGGAVKRHA